MGATGLFVDESTEFSTHGYNVIDFTLIVRNSVQLLWLRCGAVYAYYSAMGIPRVSKNSLAGRLCHKICHRTIYAAAFAIYFMEIPKKDPRTPRSIPASLRFALLFNIVRFKTHFS